MSYVVLVVGAIGIASATYLIADLISPFSGVFVVSPAPLVDVLNVVEEAAAPATSLTDWWRARSSGSTPASAR